MMNKQLLTIITLIFLSLSAVAQEENPTKNTTTFGIKGGLSFNTIRGDDGLASTDFYAGFFSTTRLSEKWSIQNELGISVIDGITFIEVPVVLKFHVNNKWSFFAGPRLDFRASKSYNTFLLNEDGEVSEIPASSDNPFGVSLEFGTQYDISKRFFVEARYGYGVSRQLVTSTFGNGRRSTFRVGLGFKF